MVEEAMWTGKPDMLRIGGVLQHSSCSLISSLPFFSPLTSKPKWVSCRRRQYGKILSKTTCDLKVNIKLLNVSGWFLSISEVILLGLIELL